MSIEYDFKLFDTRAEITKYVTDENGVTRSAKDWERLLGIKVDTIYKRMKRTDDPRVILRTDNLRSRQNGR